jgi:hypothetical protein
MALRIAGIPIGREFGATEVFYAREGMEIEL